MRIATLMDGLRPPVRAMVFLHWIFSFVGTLTGVFVHIYLFQRFGSVSFNALAQAGFFVGCVIGFSGVGVLFSFWRLNMKNGYGAAIIVFGMSFFLLLGNVGEYRAPSFLRMVCRCCGRGGDGGACRVSLYCIVDGAPMCRGKNGLSFKSIVFVFAGSHMRDPFFLAKVGVVE